MADSQRETILDALHTCLAGITRANGYAVEVREVRRGIHYDADMLNRPALGYTNTKIRREEFAAGRSGKTLTVLIYGYTNVEPGLYDPLDDLLQAVEQRLMTPAAWSYYGFTNIQDLTVYEAGAHDPVAYFDMEVEIFYEHQWATP